MSSEIAVWVNENGETTTLNTPGKIVVYRKWQGNWKADRDKVISPPSTGGMSMLRRLMSEVLEVMGKSKIFVAQKVTGIPYFELEKSTCSVWEMPGKPEDFLDYILSCEEKEQSTEQKTPPYWFRHRWKLEQDATVFPLRKSRKAAAASLPSRSCNHF